MDKLTVKMLKAHGELEEGKVYELDKATADSLINLKMAAVEVNPVDALLGDIKKMVKDEVEAGKEELVKSISKSVKTYSVPAVPKTDYSKDKGRFLTLVASKNSKALEEEYGSKWLTEPSLSTKASDQIAGTGTLGGYTIPIGFLPEVTSVQGYEPVVTNTCRNIPVDGTDVVEVPYLDQSSQPTGGNSSFYGGVRVFYASEIEAAQKANFALKMCKFELNRIVAYAQASQHLLATSPITIMAMLNDNFSGAYYQRVEYDALNGDGIGKPFGFLGSSAAKSVSRTTSSHFTFADAANMVAALIPNRNGARRRWLMHPTVMGDLYNMQSGNGALIWAQNARDAQNVQPMLLGIPVYFTENLPALASAKSVVLADLDFYGFAQRGTPVISTSEHLKFLESEIVFKIEHWIDAKPMVNNVFTLADGTSTLAPFVYLN